MKTCTCGTDYPAESLADGARYVCKCGRSVEATSDVATILRRLDEQAAMIATIQQTIKEESGRQSTRARRIEESVAALANLLPMAQATARSEAIREVEEWANENDVGFLTTQGNIGDDLNKRFGLK